MKAICFGAGGGGKRLFDEIRKRYEIIAFTDNDSSKWGDLCCGINIYSPVKCLSEMQYDYVVITSAPGLESIKAQLIKLSVEEYKIITSYVEAPLESRKVFLRSFARMFDCEPEGCVAEAGVFEGDFAREINSFFPGCTLHLFDTFEGFDERDINEEAGMSEAKIGDYNNTSVELVMSKMPFPDKCRIHKGYFPNTAVDIAENEKFIFVNLDMDLYEPTLAGLNYFSTKMVKRGVILVHDYFAENFKGPKEAVTKFMSNNGKNLHIMPIGDGISVAILGF